MQKIISALPVIQRKTKSLFRLFNRAYRQFRVRNAILAIRSRKYTDRFPSDSRRFAIFMVPGFDIVNGGIMSICSIATETQRLLTANRVSVSVCTAPGEPRMLRYTKFDNNIELTAFADLLAWFPSGSEVLVHLPELFVRQYVADNLNLYRSRPDLTWRFNILLQNIDRIPSDDDVAALKQLGDTTITIAHKASTGAAETLGCPVHYLSWFLAPDGFERVGYASKQKLVAISPDEHPAKLEIVREMSKALPDHRIIEIRNMTYQQYKDVIRDAKFMFTFGEGLDGYFVESIFSGAISMAIFEERFFTDEYRNFDGVFLDSARAISGVTDFMRTADNEARFGAIAERQYSVVESQFNRQRYLHNISSFYDKYYPEWRRP